MVKAWTDYPIEELGDTPDQEAPIREIEVLSYDQNKYAVILVSGVKTEIKISYCYMRKGRCGEVPMLNRRLRMQLPVTEA